MGPLTKLFTLAQNVLIFSLCSCVRNNIYIYIRMRTQHIYIHKSREREKVGFLKKRKNVFAKD